MPAASRLLVLLQSCAAAMALTTAQRTPIEASEMDQVRMMAGRYPETVVVRQRNNYAIVFNNELKMTTNGKLTGELDKALDALPSVAEHTDLEPAQNDIPHIFARSCLSPKCSKTIDCQLRDCSLCTKSKNGVGRCLL